MVIPNELKQLKQWVCWQLGDVNPSTGRPRKIPINPHTGKAADTSKPETWGTYDSAVTRKSQGKKLKGVGLVLTEHDPFNCFDIDGATQLNGTPNTFIKAANSFTEQSQSNDGFHIFMTGNVPDISNTKNYQLYKAGQFIAMTGKHVDGTPENIKPVKPAFIAACKDAGILREKQPQQTQNNAPSNTPNLSNQQVLNTLKHAGNAVKFKAVWNGGTHGGQDDSRSGRVMSLLAMLAPYCKNAAQLEELARQSKQYDEHLFKRKTKGNTWIATSCQKAINTRQWVYEPRPKTAPHADTVTPTHSKVSLKTIPIDVYWHVDYTGKQPALKINRAKLINYLEHEGYARIWVKTINGERESVLVNIKNNIAEATSAEEIRDFLIKHSETTNWIPDGFDNESLKNMLLNNINTSLSESVLKSVASCDKPFHQDSKDKCFIYYRNGVAVSTKDATRLISYTDIDGIIWRDQILDRDYNAVDLGDMADNGDFCRFQNLICTPAKQRIEGLHSLTEQDRTLLQERWLSLRTATGYLLHRYSDPSEIRAIIFNDEEISYDEKQQGGNGGTGKSLSMKAIAFMRTVSFIDGKSFNANERFKYQTLNQRTNVVLFDDISPKFPFDSLFAVLSDGYYMEAKGKSPIKLEQTIKTALTTNFVIKGDTPSDRRRRFEIEASAYFALNHTPFDEFKHNLFDDDWGAKQWAYFDEYMLLCVRDFLKHGLKPYHHVNIELRRLIAKTSPELVEFCNEQVGINEELDKKEMFGKFCEEYPDFAVKFRQRTFTNWLKAYADFKGYEFKTRRSNSTDLFWFGSPQQSKTASPIRHHKQYPKNMIAEHHQHFDKCTEGFDGAAKLSIIAEYDRIYKEAYDSEPQASKKDDTANRQANLYLLELSGNEAF